MWARGGGFGGGGPGCVWWTSADWDRADTSASAQAWTADNASEGLLRYRQNITTDMVNCWKVSGGPE